ncbi:MAG: hypothetical protein ACR2IP_11410 [Solirubrobacteraceae bacterium]
MDYDVFFIFATPARDPDAGERLLDALAAAHPEVGPVVEQDLEAGTLAATLTVDANDADNAYVLAHEAFTAGIEGSGLEAPRIRALRVDAVGVSEPQPA